MCTKCATVFFSDARARFAQRTSQWDGSSLSPTATVVVNSQRCTRRLTPADHPWRWTSALLVVHQNDHFRFQQHCLSILMIRKHHTAVPARLQSICVISFRSIRITITASPTVNMIADPCFQAGRRNKLLWRIRTSTTIVIGQIYTFVLLCVLCRYNSELLLSFDIWFNWYRYLQTPQTQRCRAMLCICQ